MLLYKGKKSQQSARGVQGRWQVAGTLGNSVTGKFPAPEEAAWALIGGASFALSQETQV